MLKKDSDDPKTVVLHVELTQEQIVAVCADCFYRECHEGLSTVASEVTNLRYENARLRNQIEQGRKRKR